MTFHWDWLIFIAKGAFVTIKYSIAATILGLFIGILLTIASMTNNSIASNFSKFYVSVFRGTPLLIQLSLIYYGIPTCFDVKLTILQAGIISFSMNSGAYISQIIKSGINGIDKGQFEAAESLGISYLNMMTDIILPQAIRNIVPALINEFVNLIKETAIISIIGEADIMRNATLIAQQNYNYFTPLIMAAMCYYILVTVMTNLVQYLESQWKKY